MSGLKTVARHGPDAAIFFCLLAVFTFGLYQGYNPWFLIVAILVMAAAWHFRQLSAELHKERLEIRRIEAARGQPLRDKHKARLRARKRSRGAGN